MQELVLAARPRRGGWETPRTRDMRGPGQCAGAAVAHVSPAVTSRVGLGAPALCGSALLPPQAGGRARRPERGAEAASPVRPARPAVLAGPPEPGRGTGLPVSPLLPTTPLTPPLDPIGSPRDPRRVPCSPEWVAVYSHGVFLPSGSGPVETRVGWPHLMPHAGFGWWRWPLCTESPPHGSESQMEPLPGA